MLLLLVLVLLVLLLLLLLVLLPPEAATQHYYTIKFHRYGVDQFEQCFQTTMSRKMKSKEKGEDILAKNDQSKEPDEEQRADQELNRRKLPPRQVKISNQQAAQEAGGIGDGRLKPGEEPEKVRPDKEELPRKKPRLSESMQGSRSMEFEVFDEFEEEFEEGFVNLPRPPELNSSRFTFKLPPKVNSRFTFKKEALLEKPKKGSHTAAASTRVAATLEEADVLKDLDENNEGKEEEDAFLQPAAANQVAQFPSPRADGQELLGNHVSSASPASPGKVCSISQSC